MNPVIIFGSSRSFGNTRKVTDDIFGSSGIPLVDLNNFDISPFDYEHRNKHDDFIPLIENLLDHDTWIIATPVYWYTTSAHHKIFFDRIADLLDIRKDLGRRLSGKKLFVIASFGTSYPNGFDGLFEQICEYLCMEYLGSSCIYSGAENEEFVKANQMHIEKARVVLRIKGNL